MYLKIVKNKTVLRSKAAKYRTAINDSNKSERSAPVYSFLKADPTLLNDRFVTPLTPPLSAFALGVAVEAVGNTSPDA